jgi:8-oxo-dGTP pyrophosphatase MutT (NUDIX family)
MKATLIYLVDLETEEVLMAKKVRAPGAGFLFGYGGKHSENESDNACVLRELKEESGIEILEISLQRVGIMSFFKGVDKNPQKDEPKFETVCYRAFVDKNTIHPLPTEEMTEPTWFPIANLPATEMKPGDEHFVPYIIAGIPFTGWLHFKEDNSVISYKIAV